MMIRIKLKLIVILVFTIVVLAADNLWVVRETAIGPIKIGMGTVQLNKILHENFTMPENKDEWGCFYYNSTAHPEFSLMMEGDHLVRVEVIKPGIPTMEGIQIDDSEVKLRKLYGSKLKMTKSVDGGSDDYYLTLRSADGKIWD